MANPMTGVIEYAERALAGEYLERNPVSETHTQEYANGWLTATRALLDALRRAVSPDNMTSNDLWVSLEKVLRDKGASDKWLEYAMPDLQIAAMQFSFSQYAQGHRDANVGKELPNPGPDDKPMLIVIEDDGSRWLQINGGT